MLSLQGAAGAAVAVEVELGGVGDEELWTCQLAREPVSQDKREACNAPPFFGES